jgi:hypothetical protein
VAYEIILKIFIMGKPTLNTTDLVLVLATCMVALAMHQKFVAKLVAPKK